MSIRPCLTGPEIQRVPLDGHVWACAQDHLEAILAGDAAHVFTPATGMGLNLAIHDATVLAEALTSTTEHGDQPRTLDQYEQTCKPLAEKLLEPELAPASADPHHSS